MFTSLLPTAVLTWNAQGRIQRAEGEAEALFGLTPEALVGRPLQALFELTDDRTFAFLELSKAVLGAGQTTPAPVEFATRKGATSRASSRTYRLTFFARDGEAGALVLDLDAVLVGAPPLQISGLSSSLSHEIRNPLSSVKMAVQTLQRNTGLSERDQRRLTIANREVRTMERMLGLLAEYGRDGTPSTEPLPLLGLVNEAAALVGLELSERKIELQLIEEGEPATVRVEPLRLRLVLAQLFLNVAMAFPEGGLIPVTLRSEPAGGGSLELLDPASALPPEERETLFVPFGSKLARGAGLSLAALQRAVKNQGGKVTAQGSAEPGTTFRIYFPG